ncbi:MAG TPA: DUF2752 domain-containing protein [Chryseolinea sp.]|nr:DUF2752 domain-containing protein [Chryseolinea sp.]
MSLKRNILFVLGMAAILLLLLYFYFDPASSILFPPCPFYTFTGLFCPGCGSQRAFHALLHGHILESADFNLLFVLFLPLILLAFFEQVRKLVFRTGDHKKTSIFNSTRFSKSVLIVVLLFWVLRNIPFFPLDRLAP